MIEKIRRRRGHAPHARPGDFRRVPTGATGTCALKRRYPDKRAAVKAAKRIGGSMRAYACFVCGQWHLTSREEGQ